MSRRIAATFATTVRNLQKRIEEHMTHAWMRQWLALSLLLLGGVRLNGQSRLQPLRYEQPGLEVDLGVGLWAWPMPMDYDGDGDNDLVVVCPDVPYRGTYLFENPGGDRKFPVFLPAVRIADGLDNVQVGYVDGQPRVLIPGFELLDFRNRQFSQRQPLALGAGEVHAGKIRANQWKYADLDADGRLDLIVGIGDWTEYGWDNAYDAQGRWTRGPLHGYVYWARNKGTNAQPDYEKPLQLQAGEQPADVYGRPSPNLADFDGDGDLDLLCGEFLDGFTYYQNTGTPQRPRFAAGVCLKTAEGRPLRMDLQMITPVAVDWDGDGDSDLVVGDEDGRVALVENVSERSPAHATPQFLAPRYFRQQADRVKFGALVTPVAVDWDGDGDEDLLCGNSAGYIAFLENLDGGAPPRLAPPRKLEAGGEILRIQAGDNGSIQGPCEAKWGYTTLSVADWNGDQLPDLIVNSIWGRVLWYANLGSRRAPQLAAARPVHIDWDGPPRAPAWNWWQPEPQALVTQWRTTPLAADWDNDGCPDLVMLDHEGYLCWWPGEASRDGVRLQAPRRVFACDNGHAFDSLHRRKADGPGPLRLNEGQAGASGRRKFCLVDWDGDGRRDLIVNSVSVNLLRNVADGQHGGAVFHDEGMLDSLRLAGHTTSPTAVDWNRDGRPELVVGAEDGFLYYLDRRP
jgi:hypothetical protein